MMTARFTFAYIGLNVFDWAADIVVALFSAALFEVIRFAISFFLKKTKGRFKL